MSNFAIIKSCNKQSQAHKSIRLVRTIPEVVVRRCSVKKEFLKILQNSQENTCARVSIKKETLAQVFSCEYCEISKNTFSYRAPPVAASTIPVECNSFLLFLKMSEKGMLH